MNNSRMDNTNQNTEPAGGPSSPGYPWQMVFVITVIAAGLLGIVLMITGVL